ncbi:MAG: ATP-binding protein [Bacteroidetes bacterium]|nr:ATP-binding protein [Bacteroidota bacterium]
MLILTSRLGNVAEVESFVAKLKAKYRLSPDVYGNILISLTEAVTNAITHGNHNDESKKVQIRLSIRRETLAFKVSDEGRGFDYNNLPDPTSPDNITRVGGRGVFLIRQLSDEVRFHNNGSTVEMQFRI